MKEKLTGLLEKLENSRFAPFVQFIKFGLVGVSNTLISYVVEMLCYYVLFTGMVNEQVKIVLTTLLAFVISVTNSFILNNRFVFRAEKKQTPGQIAKAYGKTVLCYALTGIVLAPILRLWLVGMGIPYWAASLMSLVVTIPLNFVMNKFWAFAGRK